MPSLKTALRTTTIAASMAMWIIIAGGLAVYALRTLPFRGGKAKEVQLLSKTVSPDGFLEARLLRIVGGPPMDGATVWQEVQLARSGSPIRFLKSDKDPGFIYAFPGDTLTPMATLHWQAPTRLVISPRQPDQPAPQGRTVLGIEVEFSSRPPAQ